LPITTILVLADQDSRYYDVYKLSILDKDTYYYYKVYSNRDFDIYKECFVIKAYCLDESYTLIKEMV